VPQGNAIRVGGPSPRLRYVSDADPGLRRERRGDDFVFVDPAGRPFEDPKGLARIRALAIPPAWTEVWICRHANGHLQATGRDAKGRKQYRYHAGWQESRSRTKFSHLAEFGAALPQVRRTLRRHLDLPGLPRDKVLAAIVRLLDLAGVRVGNEEYRKANGSFGLTTLRDRHARFGKGELKLRFRGKSGVEHETAVHDRKLARVVRQCQDIPGQRLFQYLDESGQRRAIGSAHVNAYLRKISGVDCSAKDFRTWRGSTEALNALRGVEAATSAAEAERQIREVVDSVAKILGNTRAVCRKYYIHPAIFEAYKESRLQEGTKRRPKRLRELDAHEEALLAFLKAAAECG
jgi:DNA topoisomerase-1